MARRFLSEDGQIAVAFGADPKTLPHFRMRRGKVVQIPQQWLGRTWVRGVEVWKLWKYAETKRPHKLARAMKCKRGPGHPNTHDGRIRVGGYATTPRYDWRKDYEDEL